MLYSLIDTHSAAATFYIVSVVVLSKYYLYFKIVIKNIKLVYLLMHIIIILWSTDVCVVHTVGTQQIPALHNNIILSLS